MNTLWPKIRSRLLTSPDLFSIQGIDMTDFILGWCEHAVELGELIRAEEQLEKLRTTTEEPKDKASTSPKY